MRFRIIDSLSLPGDPAKANDDAVAHETASAVVMDGATGLGEPLLDGESDAAWVAHFGAERLMAQMRAGASARDALATALHETEAAFVELRRRVPAETYEIPFASMMFVSLERDVMRALWFGDCAALVLRPGESVQIVGEAIARRARERDRVAALAASLGTPPAGKGVRETFLPALRQARNFVNADVGGWLFGPDARAADHAAQADVSAPAGTVILLVTDGFLALGSDYDRYSPEGLLDAAVRQGLKPLGYELRGMEDSDPEGARFPRFKKSDDATALLLKVEE
ncbi:MAG: hypothetical protein ABSD74_07205 [Rhizomicrobium sp.]|jgi:hypothetical protein